MPVPLLVSAMFAAPLFPAFEGEVLPLVAVGLLLIEVAPYYGTYLA